MARKQTTDKARSARRGSAVPLALALDPEAVEPLQRQLYAALRGAILEGRLAPGIRLPGTRGLAESLDVSRTTVALVFDQLRAEGYLRGQQRRGTFVAHVVPDDHLRARPGAEPSAARPAFARRAPQGRPSRPATSYRARRPPIAGGCWRRSR